MECQRGGAKPNERSRLGSSEGSSVSNLWLERSATLIVFIGRGPIIELYDRVNSGANPGSAEKDEVHQITTPGPRFEATGSP